MLSQHAILSARFPIRFGRGSRICLLTWTRGGLGHGTTQTKSASVPTGSLLLAFNALEDRALARAGYDTEQGPLSICKTMEILDGEQEGMVRG